MAITGRTATVAEANTVTGITATLPADRQAGDLVVVVFACDSSVANFTGPGGSWVALKAPQVDATGANLLAAYYQFSPAAAPAASTSGASGRWTAICQAYGGVDTTTPVDVAAVATGGNGTTLAATGVTTVTDQALILSAYMVDSSSRTLTQPGSMTLVKSYTPGAGGQALAFAEEVDAAAGATGTRTWSMSGTALDQLAFVTALRPVLVSFTGTVASTTTSTGGVVVAVTGTVASTTTTSGAGLLLGAAFGGSRSSTTTVAGALSTVSRVLVGVLEIELTAGVWTDFTGRLDMGQQPLTVRQGRPTVYDDVGAGTLACSLFNDDGAITPDSPGSAYPLTEGMRIRWKVSKSGTTWTRFVGWISELAPDFPGDSTFGARVQVTAVDALGLLGQRRLRSCWTEAALAAARAGGVQVDAYEATGSTSGFVANMTNYSGDAAKADPTYGYSTTWPTLNFSTDRDVSCGGIATCSPDTNGDSSTVIPRTRSGHKYVAFMVKTPTQIPASGAPLYVGTLEQGLFSPYAHMTIESNGAGGARLAVWNAGLTSSFGTVLNPVPQGQWVLIEVWQASTATLSNVRATCLGSGTTGTLSNAGFDVRNVTSLEWPHAFSPSAASSMGGFVALGQTTGPPAADATPTGAQGTLSSRVDDVAAAVAMLPVTVTKVGSLSTQVLTGTWDRYALDVLQELARSGLAVAWARSRDSTIHVVDAASLRPAAVLATVDTDADCAGTPRLSRSMATRPTRVQVDAPGQSLVVVDTAAEAGLGSPQRLKTVSTVCSSTADMTALGQQLLAAGSKLRITQLTVDLTTGATDHTATLFSESGTLSGLFPTARVRAVVPVSHFGRPTVDYFVQGWTETYAPRGVTVALDTDPCTTTTYVAETWTGSNGSSWSGTTWPVAFGSGLTGSTVDVQSNRGRIVSGAGGQAGRRIGTGITDVEITGSVVVTGSAEAQVWWRTDSPVSNGYGLVFSASGGVRLQQVVGAVISTRYSAAQVGGPSVVAGTDYSFRIRHQGPYLSVRAWATAGGEPTTWGLNTTDTLFTGVGYVALSQWTASGTCTFDNLTITDGA